MNDMQRADRLVGYSVRDITTPVEQLTCWHARCDEAAILAEAKQENYTYFPVVEDELIVGVLQVELLAKGVRDYETLTSRWLIAADTPILHLIELFAREPDRHFFVLASSRIVGMVTPADLNKVPARASVYLLVAHFEMLLTRLVRKFVGAGEEDLRPFLNKGRIEKAAEARAGDKSKNMELPLLHYVQLFDLVEVVASSEELRAQLGFRSKKQVQETLKFTQVRNAVAHVNNLLIVSPDKLAELNQDCENMITYSHRIEQMLNGQNGSAAVS